MRSIHDNNVYAYVVDCANQRMTLHTEFRDVEPYEYTDVVFAGVTAHFFEHVMSGNILFGIDELAIDDFVDKYAPMFGQNCHHGWPEKLVYDGNLKKLKKLLVNKSAHAYEVNSSYGLRGWILAESYQQLNREARVEWLKPAQREGP